MIIFPAYARNLFCSEIKQITEDTEVYNYYKFNAIVFDYVTGLYAYVQGGAAERHVHIPGFMMLYSNIIMWYDIVCTMNMTF